MNNQGIKCLAFWTNRHKYVEPHDVVQGGDVGVVRLVAVAGLPGVVHLFRDKNLKTIISIMSYTDLDLGSQMIIFEPIWTTFEENSIF